MSSTQIYQILAIRIPPRLIIIVNFVESFGVGWSNLNAMLNIQALEVGKILKGRPKDATLKIGSVRCEEPESCKGWQNIKSGGNVSYIRNPGRSELSWEDVVGTWGELYLAEIDAKRAVCEKGEEHLSIDAWKAKQCMKWYTMSRTSAGRSVKLT
jgi:hypothetical protein